MLRCPKCKTPISKKWLFNSNEKSEYICPKCGVVLRWSKIKRILFFIRLCFALYIVQLLKDHLQMNIVLSFLVSLLVAYCVSYIPLLIFPFIKNSICVESGNEGTNEQKQGSSDSRNVRSIEVYRNHRRVESIMKNLNTIKLLYFFGVGILVTGITKEMNFWASIPLCIGIAIVLGVIFRLLLRIRIVGTENK